MKPDLEQQVEMLRQIYVSSLYMDATVADIRVWLLNAITIIESMQTELLQKTQQLEAYKAAMQNWHEEDI